MSLEHDDGRPLGAPIANQNRRHLQSSVPPTKRSGPAARPDRSQTSPPLSASAIGIVDPDTSSDSVAAQVRRRRAAAEKLPPYEDGGRRDPLDPPRGRRARATGRQVVAVTVRRDVALIRGWPAVELLDCIAAPRSWSASGKGYVVERRYVADLLAAADTRRVLVVLNEESTA